MKRNPNLIIILFSLITLISACGGGGGGGTPPATAPTTAKLILAASGGLPEETRVGGIEITVILPTGVTVAATPDSESPDKLVVDAGSLSAAPGAPGSLINGTYTPATETDPGTVSIFIASSSGFATGEFAVLTCGLNGTNPAASAFTLEEGSFTAYGIESGTNSTLDITSALTPGLSVAIQ
jgi:hypothetical protein